MNCLPCFQNDDDDDGNDNNNNNNNDPPAQTPPPIDPATAVCNAKAFTFRELAMATKNFRQECLLGEGGFGRVFKGTLQSTGQVVAVKQLDRNGMQGNKEFLSEITLLSHLQHPNLISLIGYCADGDQRLLVYEYLNMGNLEHHLFGEDPNKKPMDWCTRMKIASGTAQGLEYLHEKANPPILYRDLKPSNILLEDSYEPKLSDYGLAKLGADGGKTHPTSRVMDTYGYSAPEYSSSGELTLKSDIYSFGVVLLELISGRRAVDTNRSNDEQNLVSWAQPIFRDPKRFPDLADPCLNKEFPVTSLNQAVGICAMCLQEEPSVRPLIGDVVAALSFLSIPQPNPTPTPAPAPAPVPVSSSSPPPEQKMHYENEPTNEEPARGGDKSKSKSDKDEESSSDEESDGNNENNESDSEEGSEGDEEEEEDDEDEDDDEDDDSGNFGDAENTEFGDSGRSTTGVDATSESEQGSSSRKRCTSTKRTGSRPRKMVVTFKEPSLSTKRNGTKKGNQEEKTTSPKTEEKGKSSSSGSSSSSDSEGEQKGDNNGHKNKKKRREASNSIDETEHRVFDDNQTEGPKLRHTQTR